MNRFVAFDRGCELMGKLTTHVLDTHSGRPAGGVRIELRILAGDASQLIGDYVTADNGRCVQNLLEDATFSQGRYELTFHIADYFRSRGVPIPEPAFIDAAVIRIGIADASQHYHVPLLITPWSYSVYRGG
jgi:5-hydroxyisourate hydrolase